MLRKGKFNVVIFILLTVSQWSQADEFKVLYLGNSHTFWNDLPQMTYELALSLGDTINFESNTPGGCTLGHPSNGHLFNSTSRSLINATDWDYVVLQEHSLFGVIDYYRDNYMFPGGLALDSLIKLNNGCTRTIIQLIWAKKSGGEHCITTHCSIDFNDYSHMQDSLNSVYLRFADSLSCMVAPSGVAWQSSIQNGDPIELFDTDESHPSLAGSYLTACVYYATISKKPSSGSSYTGGLSLENAAYLQQIADNVVFENMDLWNFNVSLPEAGFEFTQFGNTIFCTDTSSNADFYYWDFGDTHVDSIQHPDHSYDMPGTYVITQEVSTYCYTDMTTDTVVIEITDIHGKHDRESKLWVTKLPEDGCYNLVSKDMKIKKVGLYTMKANCIQQTEQADLTSYRFNMQYRIPGVYILKVHTLEGIKTIKFIHQ